MSKALVTRQPQLLASELDYILLDGSGSMYDKWRQTVAGLQQFLEVLKAKNIHSHAILHVFDTDDIEFLQRDDLIGSWPSLIEGDNKATLHGGATPLYDAIQIMVRRLAELDPPRCSIIIVTDGMETSSKCTSLAQAKNLLDWCRAKGWQITFLGADFANSKQALALGATKANSIGVQRERLEESGRLLGEKRSVWSQSGRDISFSESEQSDFGGYLAPPRDEKPSGWTQGGGGL